MCVEAIEDLVIFYLLRGCACYYYYWDSVCIRNFSSIGWGRVNSYKRACWSYENYLKTQCFLNIIEDYSISQKED